ncbi:MAG TPA: single-stranded-DNA-specific exonuclease RecJ, partial [Tissierellaceae bacterium]|nr:single-stranded-DNA-specific exonuclease RecJ [Tissierellaceae bacterium]
DRLHSNCLLEENDFVKKIYIDMQVPIEYIEYKLIDDLTNLEPFGMGNPKPLFGDKGLKIRRMFKFGKDKNIIKLILESKAGLLVDGMIFYDDSFEQSILERYGKDELDKLLNGSDNNVSLDIIYYPSINEYMGKTSIQVIIQAFRL